MHTKHRCPILKRIKLNGVNFLTSSIYRPPIYSRKCRHIGCANFDIYFAVLYQRCAPMRNLINVVFLKKAEFWSEGEILFKPERCYKCISTIIWRRAQQQQWKIAQQQQSCTNSTAARTSVLLRHAYSVALLYFSYLTLSETCSSHILQDLIDPSIYDVTHTEAILGKRI